MSHPTPDETPATPAAGRQPDSSLALALHQVETSVAFGYFLTGVGILAAVVFYIATLTTVCPGGGSGGLLESGCVLHPSTVGSIILGVVSSILGVIVSLAGVAARGALIASDGSDRR